MTGRLAILCSGQGGQAASMLPLLQSDTGAWQCWLALEESWRQQAGHGSVASSVASSGASSVTSSDAGEDCSEFPDWLALLEHESRFQNRYAQVLVVAFGLAAWQALQPWLPQPALVAGYSVGEMTALAVTGALDPQAVLALTRQRANLMDVAAREPAIVGAEAAGMSVAQEQGLMAISGVPWRALAGQIQAAGAFIAIDNGEQSCVLGGYHTVLATLAPRLQAQGAHTQAVAVRVAAHTPLLAAAAPAFLQLLQQQSWQRARCPALAALDARRVIRFENACASMAQALHQTIHWADAMDALAEGGIGVALELGPGSSLCRMLQQRHPGMACRSLADFRSLQAAREWVEKQLAG